MYFRIQKQAQLLHVDDDYARLEAVHSGGDLQFVFFYTVSQSKAIQYRATRVSITLETRSVSKRSMLGNSSNGRVDTRALVNNIRSAVLDAKTATEQQMRYVVAHRDSDISSMINNESIPQLRARVPVSRIPAMSKTKLVLASAGSVKQGNDPKPLLHRVVNSLAIPDLQTALSASAGVSPQSLMHDMIIRQGIDPSYVLQLTSRTSSEASTRAGTSHTAQAMERPTDPSAQLLNRYLFSPVYGPAPSTSDGLSDADTIQVVRSQTTDEVTVPCRITVPVRRLRIEGTTATQLCVTFELIDGATGLPVDTVTRVLDVARHLRIYNTPKVPPRVGFSRGGSAGRINLEIKQLDPGATGVQVYKKTFWVASPEVDTYSLVGTYALTSRDQSLLVQVDTPRFSPVLYRVIPVNQSVQGFEYTNVAIRPARYGTVRSAALTAHHSDTGVRLELRKIPTNVVAVHFMRWNLTTHERSPITVGSDVGFVDESVRQSDILVTIDSAVTPDNVYRYQARLIYRDGSMSDCGDATIDFLRPSPGQVDTRIIDLTVSHDESPNVVFTIDTRTIDGDLDVVKQMLEKQGIVDLFKGDMAAQRDQLRALLAHNVQRIDLTSGRREDFGVITDPNFDDAALRNKHAVGQLQYGHRYRYEVHPLLRAPETMFDGYVKTATDVVTKKPYMFSPSKFLHPFTQSRGVIMSTAGARLRYAKDPMAYGVIGSVATTEVSFDNDAVNVTDATVAGFDRRTNLVTWNVSGDIANIDHFIVMKQVHGIRTTLGKAHSSFANGSCQYVHVLTPDDRGALQYVVLPILGDYRLGAEAVTNTLIVETV